MRRIIERTVTVVTTTTWKISWELDTPPSSSERDPVHSAGSNTDALPAAQTALLVNETKEVDPPEAKT